MVQRIAIIVLFCAVFSVLAVSGIKRASATHAGTVQLPPDYIGTITHARHMFP